MFAQATPNISPSCSLRSFSLDSNSAPSAEAILTAIENEVTLQMSQATMTSTPPTITKSKVQRRVSFSEEEIERQSTSSEWQKQKNNNKGPLRQNTLPTTMAYLTVPGQPTITLMAPALTVEAFAAQTSVQARKRRSTRLMKAGSFCSITSEGDGDIFSGSREGELPEDTINEGAEDEEVVIVGRKTMDPLSDYSEFYDNDKSDISDLFENPAAATAAVGRCRLRGQRTLSEEYGSIRSLSMDNDEPQCKFAMMQPGRSVDDDDDMYASSSCSISIESDCEPGRGHQITVPVTIEPPPPEMRTTACANNNSSVVSRRDHHHHSKKVCQIHHPSKAGNKGQDSVEEIKRASPGSGNVSEARQRIPETEKEEPEVTSSEVASGMRMVLVRDIGVQVSGDSPNLNLHRRTHKRHQQQQQQQQPVPQRQDSLAEQFPAEILF